MNFENINSWCWLIPLLVGLICTYFGYLIGKRKRSALEIATNLKHLKAKNAQLLSDLDICTSKLLAKEDVAPSIPVEVTTNSFTAEAAKAAFGKTIKEDDLKIIEGIGPKIESMFKEAGINTWKLFSETATLPSVKKYLMMEVPAIKYMILRHGLCKARMAYEGKWKRFTKVAR